MGHGITFFTEGTKRQQQKQKQIQKVFVFNYSKTGKYDLEK